MVRNLNYHSSVLVFLLEIRITRSKMQSDPHAAQFVPAFEGVRGDCMQVLDEEVALLEAKSDAQALVDAANVRLNRVINRVSKALLAITEDKTDHPLYVLYMKKQKLTALKRPSLGPKLEHVREWQDKATNSQHASLQALAPEIVGAVAAGDQAASAKKEAGRRLREFRVAGNRRRLVDRLNGLRKETHGALSRIALEHPELPARFADQFFRKAPKRADADEEEAMTVEEALAEVEARREALAEAEERLAELEAEAAAEASAAEARAADEAALAALEAQMATLEAQRATLQARVQA